MAAAALCVAALTTHLTENRLCAADNHTLKARFQFRSGDEVFDLPNVFVWMRDPKEVERANQLSAGFNPVANRVNHFTITELRTKPGAFIADATKPITFKYVGSPMMEMKTQSFRNDPLHLILKAGETFSMEMPEREIFPVHIGFRPYTPKPFKSTFQGFVFPSTHRFAGVSNDKGELTIEGVPAGTFGFRIWLGGHLGYPKSLSINGKQFTPRSGVQRVVIGTHGSDLGNVIVVPRD